MFKKKSKLVLLNCYRNSPTITMESHLSHIPLEGCCAPLVATPTQTGFLLYHVTTLGCIPELFKTYR